MDPDDNKRGLMFCTFTDSHYNDAEPNVDLIEMFLPQLKRPTELTELVLVSEPLFFDSKMTEGITFPAKTTPRTTENWQVLKISIIRKTIRLNSVPCKTNTIRSFIFWKQ